MKKFYLFFVVLIGFVLASCSNMITDLGSLTKPVEDPEENLEYRVEHYFERVEDSDFDLNKSFTKSGAEDQVNLEEVVELPGFYYVPDLTTKETVDSVCTVKHYYKRNIVTLTINIWPDDPARIVQGKYGLPIDSFNYELESEKRGDFEFKGWDKYYQYLPAEDCESNAQWDQTYARYTVIQKKEKLDGSYDETSWLQGGKPGELTDLNPEEFIGFELPVYTNTVIAADDSTEVEIVYNRKFYTLTFKLSDNDEVKQECKWNSKAWDDSDKSDDYIAKVKYGHTIPEVVKEFVKNPVRGQIVYENADANWGFAGWNNEYNLPETVTGDITFVAKWAKPASIYIVCSKFENLENLERLMNRLQLMKNILDRLEKRQKLYLNARLDTLQTR